MIFKNRGWLAVAVASCALWHLIFEWPILDYPSYAKGPCYSPNHEYYITSHQTLWEAAASRYPIAFGTARLFNRSGKLLYEEKTDLDGEYGPFWVDRPENNPSLPSEVFYMDGRGPGWNFVLPTPPGKKIQFKSCYLEDVDSEESSSGRP